MLRPSSKLSRYRRQQKTPCHPPEKRMARCFQILFGSAYGLNLIGIRFAVVPFSFAVEYQRDTGGNHPSKGPRAPDSGGTQRSLGEDHRQHHPQNQIGEGGDHKADHIPRTSEDTIRHQLGGDDKIEGGEDPQIQDTGLKTSHYIIQKLAAAGAASLLAVFYVNFLQAAF